MVMSPFSSALDLDAQQARDENPYYNPWKIVSADFTCFTRRP